MTPIEKNLRVVYSRLGIKPEMIPFSLWREGEFLAWPQRTAPYMLVRWFNRAQTFQCSAEAFLTKMPLTAEDNLIAFVLDKPL